MVLSREQESSRFMETTLESSTSQLTTIFSLLKRRRNFILILLQEARAQLEKDFRSFFGGNQNIGNFLLKFSNLYLFR